MNTVRKETTEITKVKDTIYREEAIEVVYKLVEELPPKSILSKEPNKIYPSDVVKALSALPSAEVVSREVYEKHIQADEQIIDSYRREFAEVASVEAMNRNYKGLCAVCADKQVCEDAKRSLDIMECSRFELDTRYHVSANTVSREEYDVLYKKWVEAEQMVDYYDIDGDDEMAIKAQSAEAALQLNRIDTLIIANALRYLINDEERHELDRATAESLRKRILKYGASMCKNSEDK